MNRNIRRAKSSLFVVSLLFEKHPELSDFFSDTNMRRQHLKLMVALQTVVYQHRRPNAAMSSFIQELGLSHRECGILSLW